MPVFRCPACDKLFRCGPDSLGRTVHCINCMTPFTIPSDNTLFQPPPADASLRHAPAPPTMPPSEIVWQQPPAQQAPAVQEIQVHIEREAPVTDAPGVISLIFGVLGVVCMFIGCLLWPAAIVATGFSLIGAPLGFFAKGNLRVAGILLNFLVLIPALILIVIGVLAYLHGTTAPGSHVR